MTDPRFIKGMAIGVASIGLALPNNAILAESRPGPAQAGRTEPAAAAFEDIALTAGGTLTGRVVDSTGTPTEGAQVLLHQGKDLIGETVSDKSGTYSFKGLRGGIYQLTSADSHRAVRVWKDNTAPPGARDMALLVTGANGARGQLGVLTPVNLLLAGGTASAASAGAVALAGSNNRVHPSARTSATTRNSPSNSLSRETNSSAARVHGPAGAMPVKGSADSIRQGIVMGDDHFPKVVISPLPFSP